MSAVTEKQAVRVDPEELTRFVARAYESAGVPPEDAAVAAAPMVRTDARGQHTHGVYFLPTYVQCLTEGGMMGTFNPKAKPRVVRETRGTAVLDGDAGLGSVVTTKAVEIAARKAREVGMGTVLVRNSNHFGAAGIYTLMLAEQGLGGLVMANTGPGVAAPGSRGGVFGTQPISYCFPNPDGEGHVMLDMALSHVAGTKVLQAITKGESIPEGWLTGPDGKPTTNPNDLMQGGALVPMGGHKGYGLGMLVEIMSGVLSGAGITKQLMAYREQPGLSSNTGHFVAAFDLEAFMPAGEFERRLAELRAEVHAAPVAEGANGIILPGEPEWRHEADTRANGLELEQFLWDGLVKLAQERGLTAELPRLRG